MLFWSGGMCNFFVSLILLFNTLQIKQNICRVEKIEYITSNSVNNNVCLNLEVQSTYRDIFELKVYFYDKEKELINNKWYSSALVIQGRKDTQAKVPIDVADVTYLNIIVYSGNLEKEIENIMLPLYRKSSSMCDLTRDKLCVSSIPSVIKYENKEIKEFYSNVTVVNDSLSFFSFTNRLPLDKIHLISNSHIDEKEGWAILRLKSGRHELFSEEDTIPLKMASNNNVFYFELAENYYVNIKDGRTSISYIEDSYYINEIVFPYIDEQYNFELEIHNLLADFETILVSFDVKTRGDLVGDCKVSKYCVRRSYL